MDTLPDKKKQKRASKGKRKHTRRLKQEARKANVTGIELRAKLR